MAKLPEHCSGKLSQLLNALALGASHVDNWYKTELKPFVGGSSQDIEVGDSEHGFGHIWSKILYKVGKKPNETQAIDL